MSYYKTQLNKLTIDDHYPMTIKLFDAQGYSCHHLSLNEESIPEIVEYLQSYLYKRKEIYLRRLIEGKPNDIKLLKQEYYDLTGKQYRSKKNA